MVLLKVSVLAVVLLAMAAGRQPKDPLSAAFQALTGEEEKTEFLMYFLALGLQDWAMSQPRPPKFLTLRGPDALSKTLKVSKESIEKFENLNIPKNSTRKLLEWTKKEFNLSTRNVVDLVKRKEYAGLIGFPDIGELCCPW